MIKKSKKNIIFFIIFFILIIFFCLYWKYSSIMHKKEITPLKYEEIIKKINIKNFNNLNEAEKFIIQNKNIYGTLAALCLSKKYIAYNNFNKAFLQLSNSLKYTKDKNLKNILKLRMAKIKIQTSENQLAIDILEDIKDHNWENIVENMKGDIFLKMNKKNEAIKSWKKSLSTETSNASKEIINMKINELSK